MRKRRIQPLLLICSMMMFTAPLGSSSRAQSPAGEGQSHSLKPTEFAKILDNKIAAKRAKGSPTGDKLVAKFVPKSEETAPVQEGVDVGLTFWQLREMRAGDARDTVERARIVKIIRDKAVETEKSVVPVRAESDAAFTEGDLLRFSIEMPFAAYLYILNQEQYADGTTSDPYLVFPREDYVNKTDRGRPGKLLFIPSQDSQFVITSIDSGNKKKVAEVFTLLLSPERLSELPPLKLDEDPRRIAPERLNNWVQKFKGQMWKFEQSRGIELVMTKAEKEADAAASGELTDADPIPQTVYHVAHKAGEPLLLTIPVKIKN